MSSVPGLILQHEASAPPALLEGWLRTRGIAFTVHHAGQGPLPDPRRFSFVTSLGSESSAVDLDPPWIPEEIDALRAAIAGEVPVLGICFGGQALSCALGGGTDRAGAPEVGWIVIDSHDGGIPDGPWAQYHNEVMRVPPGAQLLARSPVGTAAYRIGPHLGVQFHPEATPEIVNAWARADVDLPAAGITLSDLAEQGTRHGTVARESAFALFDGWWRTGPGARGVEQRDHVTG
jgi:GMP synthase-like glutamine amidotransferase